MKAIAMEDCGYLWTANYLNILNYLLVFGFGWIHTEVCVAEREGFEPPVRRTYNRFRVYHLKPLGHLSG